MTARPPWCKGGGTRTRVGLQSISIDLLTLAGGAVVVFGFVNRQDEDDDGDGGDDRGEELCTITMMMMMMACVLCSDLFYARGSQPVFVCLFVCFFPNRSSLVVFFGGRKEGRRRRTLAGRMVGFESIQLF